jgi:hypothetical protein
VYLRSAAFCSLVRVVRQDTASSGMSPNGVGTVARAGPGASPAAPAGAAAGPALGANWPPVWEPAGWWGCLPGSYPANARASANAANRPPLVRTCSHAFRPTGTGTHRQLADSPTDAPRTSANATEFG